MSWADILQYIKSIYSEALFWQFPVAATVLGIVAFQFWALPMTWLAWKDFPSLQKYKTQNRSIDVVYWLRESYKCMALNYSIGFVAIVLSWPVLRFSGVHAGPLPAWYVMVGQILLFILLDDFLYYWMHRAMHGKWLFRHVHSVHHRVRTPCAIAGNYLHWAEYLATISLLLAGPVLVGAHVVTLWIWVVIRQLEAADGHFGYDLPWNPQRFLPLYDGSSYHDFHHGRFKGNFAGALGFADKLFGTRSEGYEQYEALKARGEAPASAWRGAK